MAKYFKTKDIAEHFNISKSTVNNYIRDGVLPQPKIIGHSRRWSEQEIAEFEENL